MEVKQNIIEQMAEKLIETFQPNKIYLFGSFAWGKPNDDSDVDLMVIISNSFDSKIKRAVKGYQALNNYRNIPTDLLVRTQTEFEKYSNVSGSLYHQILNEGILLYDRGT